MILIEPNVFVSGVFDRTVTLDYFAAQGIFDEEFDQIIESEGRAITLTVSRGVADLLSHGSRAEVDDRQFEVIGIQPIDDGQYVDLILMELEPLPALGLVNAQIVGDLEIPLGFVNADLVAMEDMSDVVADSINGDPIFINEDPVLLGAQ